MTDISLHKFNVNIEDEMKRSYMDYAMSVIIGRALPDVRDGLKPAHRRVLYGMHEDGLQPNRPYKKSAATVGTVMSRLARAKAFLRQRLTAPPSAAMAHHRLAAGLSGSGSVNRTVPHARAP